MKFYQSFVEKFKENIQQIAIISIQVEGGGGKVQNTE